MMDFLSAAEVSLADATCSSSSGTELLCPFCYEDFTDVGSLLAHIEEEEHAHPRRTVVRHSCCCVA